MRRRTVITSLGASVTSLTGCLGHGSLQNDRREVRLSSVDDVPSDSPLELTAEALRSRVTADRTARIRVAVTNSTDQSVWNSTVRIPVFDSFVTETGPQGQRLLLLDPDEGNPTVGSGCYRSDLTERELQWYYTDVVTDVRYDPGETRATAFDVYGHPENTGPCLPPGDYRIESRYLVGGDADAEEARWEFEWGFHITVDEL